MITPTVARTVVSNHTTMAAILPQILLMCGFALVFYFLIWRPQATRQQEHQLLLTSLKVGDKVYTNAGIVGEITKLSSNDTRLQSGDANLIVQKSSIVAIVPKL